LSNVGLRLLHAMAVDGECADGLVMQGGEPCNYAF